MADRVRRGRAKCTSDWREWKDEHKDDAASNKHFGADSPVLVKQHMEKENLMKKVESEEDDDLRPEYDFSQMKGGVRGKYAERYREGTNLVLLDPDVAAAFPDAKAVNDALRLLLEEKQSPHSR